METPTVPDQVLIEIVNRHLPYEIDILRQTYRLLTVSPPMPETNPKSAEHDHVAAFSAFEQLKSF